MTPRGRYAPSPTGALHLGNARTALVAWLDARRSGGELVLRMEDLDPQRSSAESARRIVDDLRWLGLDWDEGPIAQSERGGLYAAAIDRLLAEGKAFRCTCSRADVARASNAPHAGEDGPRYPGLCRDRPSHPERPSSVRLVVEPGLVAFDDLLAGPQAFDVSATVGDFVIQRADGVAAYQLAVVVDDAAMRITRVVRGDDLLSSTPRQLLLFRALNLAPPEFAHVPLLLDEAGERLAKRGGALSLEALRARGMRPEKLVGWFARTLGLGDGRPVPARELVGEFAWNRLARAPARVSARNLDALLE